MMLCIDSLKIEYDEFIRNWFLDNFTGIFCYKNKNGVIFWDLPKRYAIYTMLIEYKDTFSPIHSDINYNIDYFKQIIKKKTIL